MVNGATFIKIKVCLPRESNIMIEVYLIAFWKGGAGEVSCTRLVLYILYKQQVIIKEMLYVRDGQGATRQKRIPVWIK